MQTSYLPVSLVCCMSSNEQHIECHPGVPTSGAVITTRERFACEWTNKMYGNEYNGGREEVRLISTPTALLTPCYRWPKYRLEACQPRYVLKQPIREEDYTY